ncbi:uracil-DNA glycosylase family protein [Holosporaceae bacterium 'Namur']|nr:uracil-DNA glycosylase family protein [Holosporaceae bacterium 'Namur']
MDINEIILEIENYISSIPGIKNGYKPILQLSPKAKLLIIGQAPGRRAQESGIPWNDRSGDTLRSWLNLSREDFYNKDKIAIMPIGFYYTGVDKHGGDNPPDINCAKLWHQSLIDQMPNIELTLLIGSYAQNYYLKRRIKNTMSDTIQAWKDYLPEFLVLPHPSWRNNAWIKKNKWFNEELLPEANKIVGKVLPQEEKFIINL